MLGTPSIVHNIHDSYILVSWLGEVPLIIMAMINLLGLGSGASWIDHPYSCRFGGLLFSRMVHFTFVYG